MTLTGNIQAVKDNAKSALASGINASTTSIPVTAGQGSLFPQPYNGTTTSGGTSTTLNCTGISATIGGSAAVGKPIFNATDGSVAFIKTVSANSLTTTPLLGGSDNTWQNGDTWRIDEFVVSIMNVSTNAYGVETLTSAEEVLIIGRSTDTLTAASSGGRGYNSTTATTWSTGAPVRLLVIAPMVQRLVEYIDEVVKQVETDGTNITTNTTAITNIRSGSDFYAVATGSSNAYAASYANIAAPLAAGMRVSFLANFTNTGSATLTVTLGGSAQSAKTIKKTDGATNLSSGEIQNGQMVHVEYDGTNFQLLNPTGQNTFTNKTVYFSGTSSTQLTNPTTDTTFDTHSYTIPANDLVSGVGYEFEAAFTINIGAGSLELGVMLGGTRLVATNHSSTPSFAYIRGFIAGTAAAGASVAVRGTNIGGDENSSSTGKGYGTYATVNFATNGSLALTLFAKFGTSNGSNTATCVMAHFRKVSTTPFA